MKLRILTAEFMHETNTFSRIATDRQAFRNRYYLLGAEAIAERGEQNTELAGFLDIGRKYDWQIDHVLSAAAGPGGKVTSAAFDWLTDPIVAAVGEQQYDGILLGLHGAMVTDFCEDGEGELLQRLRAVAGDSIPIAITLDLHANVSRKMCALADIIVSYKTYPHIDMRETARHAGEILQRNLRKEISPRTIRIGCPMLEEINGARTDSGPMIERIRAARQWEQREDTFAVSINGGFASADITEVGPTVLITGEGDMEAHREFASSLAADIWQHRQNVVNDYLDVAAAAAIAATFTSSEGPLIIADYADNPGAGSYGDATNLLRALLDIRVSNACFGPLVDGDTVQQLSQHEPGDLVPVKLGGEVDPPLRRSCTRIAGGTGFPERWPLCRRRSHGRWPAWLIRADRGGEDRWNRGSDYNSCPADARSAAVQELRHRADIKKRDRAQINAAFPSRLRTDCGARHCL